MRGVRSRGFVLAAIVGAWLVAGTVPAAAHSFLAETRPAQGARLDSPPNEVAIQLSEAIDPDTVSMHVRGVAEGDIDAGRPEVSSDGLVVRLALVEPPLDVLSVSWEVTSAVDGHSSAGEFSFAAGDLEAVNLDAQATSAVAQRPSMPETVGAWVFFIGLAVGAASWLVAGRSGDGVVAAFPGTARGWLRTGAVLALLGLLAREIFGGAELAAFGTAELITAASLAAALLLSRFRTMWPSLAALSAAALAWAGRGHAATFHGALGWLLDTAHLVAASAWVGGLIAVVVAMARRRVDGSGVSVLPLVRRYARGTVAAVAVLIASGVVSATLLVSGWQEFFDSGYGNLLTAKIVLVVIAVGLALIGRRWLLPKGRLDGLRWLTRPELAGLAAALAVAAVLIDVAPPERELDVDWLLGAPPMEGDVARTADLAGHLMLDVQAGEGRLDVNVRGPSGGIDAELDLTAKLPNGEEVEMHPRPCGVGCFTQSFDLPPGETVLTVEADADDWQGGSADLGLTWPPQPDEPERFERMRRTMARVERVLVAEASDEYPTDAATGFELDGEGLVELMPWAGGGVTAVRSVPGQPDRFTFYLSGSTMWFTVTVDEHGRLLTQRLVNPGHDLRYRFAYPPAETDGEEAR